MGWSVTNHCPCLPIPSFFHHSFGHEGQRRKRGKSRWLCKILRKTTILKCSIFFSYSIVIYFVYFGLVMLEFGTFWCILNYKKEIAFHHVGHFTTKEYVYFWSIDLARRGFFKMIFRLWWSRATMAMNAAVCTYVGTPN